MPLPTWFCEMTHGLLSSCDQIRLLADDMAHRAEKGAESTSDLLDEINSRLFFAPKGRPIFTASMIRFSLLLKHTSLQAYRLFLEKFPLPSISLLRKLQGSGVDSMKAIIRLRDTGEMSSDLCLMIDEMYRQYNVPPIWRKTVEEWSKMMPPKMFHCLEEGLT